MRSEADRRFCDVKITREGSALVQQLCDGSGLIGDMSGGVVTSEDGEAARRASASPHPESNTLSPVQGASQRAEELVIIKFYDQDPKRATEQATRLWGN